jgi:16S rRNA (guanine966-N2)-methyltransferase
MRIIAGKYKSRRLISPPSSLTRPTSDRARESIFNILNSLSGDLTDTYVLDAFAGSGALGLEALSRGAQHVYFMEKDPRVIQFLKSNISNLSADGECTVIQGDATKPPKASQPMDVIFLDPPYDQTLEDVCITALHNQGWVNHDTLSVLETSSKREIKLPPNAQIIDQRRYGAALFTFLVFPL